MTRDAPPRMATETDHVDGNPRLVRGLRGGPFDPDEDVFGEKVRHGQDLVIVYTPASGREYRKAYEEYPIFRSVVDRYVDDHDTDFEAVVDETAGQKIAVEAPRIGVPDVSRLENVTWNRDRPDISTVDTHGNVDEDTDGPPYETFADAVADVAADAAPDARERVAAFFERHATRVSETPDDDPREDPDDVPEYEAVGGWSEGNEDPNHEPTPDVADVKQAYVDGDIDEVEFENRLDQYDDPDDLVEDPSDETPTTVFVRPGRVGFDKPHTLTSRMYPVPKRAIAFFVVAPIAVVAGVVDMSGAIAFVVGVAIYHAVETYL